MIKIPATVEGLTATTACLAEGIRVNATLIFSLQRYEQVAEAYLNGLEQARAAGLPLARIASVASFFISRMDSAVDPVYEAFGTAEAKEMRDWTAIGNAVHAYESYQRTLRTLRWLALAGQGARTQRLLWASTGIKDPAYRDTKYVEELVAPDTVNTMPEATLEAVADHGDYLGGDRLRDACHHARRAIDYLDWFEISYEELVEKLTGEGLEKFDASWTELLDAVGTQLDKYRP